MWKDDVCWCDFTRVFYLRQFWRVFLHCLLMFLWGGKNRKGLKWSAASPFFPVLPAVVLPAQGLEAAGGSRGSSGTARSPLTSNPALGSQSSALWTWIFRAFGVQPLLKWSTLVPKVFDRMYSPRSHISLGTGETSLEFCANAVLESIHICSVALFLC